MDNGVYHVGKGRRIVVNAHTSEATLEELKKLLNDNIRQDSESDIEGSSKPRKRWGL